MKQQYVIHGYIAHSEKDNYANGCIGECRSEFVSGSDWSIRADSLQELINSLSFEFCALDENSFIFNACDEFGRIDLQIHQRQPFVCARPSAKSIADWKADKIYMWLTTYSFQVEIVQSEVDLQTLIDSELRK